MIIQPFFGGCFHLRIAIALVKTVLRRLPSSSDCLIPLIKPPSISMRQRAVHHKKPFPLVWPTARCIAQNRRSAVSYVSTGLARLPRDTGGTRNYRRSAVVEMPSPHRHRRGATALFRNPIRGAKRMRAGILRILQISRAGGTPLPMAGR